MKRFEELEKQSYTIRLLVRKPFSEERLDIDAIDKIMRAVDEKFLYSNILRRDCLKILLLNNSHGMFNSFVLSQVLPSGRRDDAIVMPYKNPAFPYSQKVSLFHELEHILHLRLTGTDHELPENFRGIQEIMFYGSLDAAKEEICEIYADCFAFAAVCDTPLENESVLKNAHENDKKILEKYFCSLFDFIKQYIEQNTKQT